MHHPILLRRLDWVSTLFGRATASPDRRPAGTLVSALLCTLLSAGGFFLSLNLGGVWWLAWLAPIPVLYLAFGETRAWAAFLLAWASYALGATNLLSAYAGSLPVPILMLSLGGPALLFAASVMGARRVARRIGPLAGVLAFAVLWAGSDYLLSLGHNGSITSPAYSQTGMPWLIQGASVFGIWVITFSIGFVSAGLAMSLHTRTRLPALLAVALFAANAGFGAWRIDAAANTAVTRIGLGVDDSQSSAHGGGLSSPRASAALGTVDAYVDAAHELAAQGATLIVFPEKVAILLPAWRAQALAKLSAAARDTRATIVIGFNDRGADTLNDALIFTPGATQPQSYSKRRFVPKLEDGFKPGTSNFVMPEKLGVAICKDMDYPTMLRHDQQLGHPTLLAVPAYDFGADRRFHARLAIMRGVEDGFALARASKRGLLTLTDATGRMVAMRRSAPAGMVTLVGDLPRGPGDTPYVHIGDAFAWGCLAIAIGLLGLSYHKTRARDAAQPATGVATPLAARVATAAH